MTIDSKSDQDGPMLPNASLDTAAVAASASIKPTRLLRLVQVRELVGLKTATIYQLLQKGEFPANVKITQRAVGWAEEDVQRWMLDRGTFPSISVIHVGRDVGQAEKWPHEARQAPVFSVLPWDLDGLRGLRSGATLRRTRPDYSGAR